MRKNTGFTLIEILVAVALTGVILMTGYSAFQRIMQAQARLGATIDIQKNLFYTNEKLAALIRDGGTIDYEEYFNRRMLGYAQSTTDGVFTFTDHSHFGNGNSSTGAPPIYYCGVSTISSVTEEICLTNTTPGHVDINRDEGDFITAFPPLGQQQPYGQYEALSLNYLDPVGYPFPIQLPPIFLSTSYVGIFNRGTNNKVIDQKITDVGLPELYLIKENLDGTYERTYFRHVYVDDSAVTTPTCDPTKDDVIGNELANIAGCLGKIQMTKLTSCDSLPYTAPDSIPDGVIDAWIPQCEFNTTASNCSSISDLAAYSTATCPTNVNAIYHSAHEEIIISSPSNIPPNLTWVDVTSPDMNVVRAAFLPSPLKIPKLMSGAGDDTRAAQVSLYLEVMLSTRLRNKSFVLPAYNYPRTLITTYDLSE